MQLNDLENRITGSVEDLSSSVVTIRSLRNGGGNPFYNAPVQGSGSGFVIDTTGHIVTNYHVIDGSGKVEVLLKDGRTFEGSVVGGDKATDVALVKINATHLKAAHLGNSEKLRVGQMALAIGNALDLPGAPTVSAGVVSAIGRPMPWADFIFEGLLQTDAAINPGNSGGPLADLDGNVIGINTAMVAFAQGVGFAIPINTVKWVVEQLLQKGRVIRPMLGVTVSNMNPAMARRFSLPTDRGVLLTEVFQGKPAGLAGMREGDIVVEVGKEPVGSVRELLVALSKHGINEEVGVTFLRAGRRQETRLKLVEAELKN